MNEIRIPTACITCGKAIFGASRCPEHRRGNWQRRKPSSAAYSDPVYLKNRKTILKDGPLCHWCGVAPATTADHLIAVSQGGGNDIENMRPSCRRCNERRGASLGGQVTKLRRKQRR